MREMARMILTRSTKGMCYCETASCLHVRKKPKFSAGIQGDQEKDAFRMACAGGIGFSWYQSPDVNEAAL